MRVKIGLFLLLIFAIFYAVHGTIITPPSINSPKKSEKVVEKNVVNPTDINTTKGDDRIIELEKRVDSLMEAKKYREAVEYLTEYIRVNPDQYEAWRLLSIAYEEMKDFHNALNAIEEYLKYNPNWESALHQKADLLDKLGFLKQSMAVYERIILSSENPELLYMGQLLDLAKKHDAYADIEEFFVKLSDKYPDNYNVLHSLSEIYDEQKKVHSAILVGEKILAKHPNDFIRGELGQDYLVLKEYGKAEETLRPHVESLSEKYKLEKNDKSKKIVNKLNLKIYTFLLAEALYFQGKHQESIDTLAAVPGFKFIRKLPPDTVLGILAKEFNTAPDTSSQLPSH